MSLRTTLCKYYLSSQEQKRQPIILPGDYSNQVPCSCSSSFTRVSMPVAKPPVKGELAMSRISISRKNGKKFFSY